MNLGASLRAAFLMYLAISLVAAPCADWLSGLMTTIAGVGDLRDGGHLMEAVREGTIAWLMAPVAFGLIVMVPLALPLRMIWLSALDAPEDGLRAHVRRGLRRTPAAAVAFFAITALGLFVAVLLATGAYLVHASFDGDPNGRRVAIWTAMACLPLCAFVLVVLTAMDLAHAACLRTSPGHALRFGARQSLRALPAYGLFLALSAVLFVAGASLEATPWVLLVALQPFVFARYFARSLWLRHALGRVTSAGVQAM